MAAHLSRSELPEPSSDDLELNILDFKTTQASAVQEEEFPSLPRIQLISPLNGDGSHSKRELQRLSEMFHSWLKPEKHSKEEMIFQLVLEQFSLTGRCKDKAALREKWESSGRNTQRFIESVSDDCLKPPVWVHICMQGEEALFDEHMPLRDVIMHLKEQRAAKIATREHARTAFQTVQDIHLEAGLEDGYNDLWETTKVKERITDEENQIESVFIIQEENSPEPGEGGVSDGNPQDASTARQGSSGPQEVSIKEPSYEEDVTVEVQPGVPCRSEQSTSQPDPMRQNHNGNSSGERQKGRSRRVKATFKCEQCPQTFWRRCYLLNHQKRHRNERTVFCEVCHKGFYYQSELQIHQVIHSGEKPFTCSTCERSFGHKTNLLAHQRIHTGEKPYTCSMCHLRFRHSSAHKED